MIYQYNDTFKVFPFIAEVNGVIYYIDNKEEFEKRLLHDLEMRKAREEKYIQENSIELPEITYRDFSLNNEQQMRFDEVTNCSTVTLDDVSNYVFEGVTSNVEFNLKRSVNELNDKNISLVKENTDLKNDMANILMYLASI